MITQQQADEINEPYAPLFDHMAQDHDLKLTIGQLDDIILACREVIQNIQPPQPPKNLVSISEASEKTEIDRQKIYSFVRRGIITPYKKKKKGRVKESMFVCLDELTAYLSQ